MSGGREEVKILARTETQTPIPSAVKLLVGICTIKYSFLSAVAAM
jgi:hypothetical protein